MALALISDQVGTHLPITLEWPTLISNMEGTKSSHHDRMSQPLHLTCSSKWIWILALIYDMEGTESSHRDRMDQPLHLTCSLEWLWISSLSLGGNLDMENTKLLPEVLKLHYGQWLCQHNSYLFLRHNILEVHCSSLHHNPDIVTLDLDVLRIVMEHWIL